MSSKALLSDWAGRGRGQSIARYKPSFTRNDGLLVGEVIRSPTKEEKEKAGEIGTASGGVHYMSPFNPRYGGSRGNAALKRATKKKSSTVKKSVTPTLENRTRVKHVVGGFAKRQSDTRPNHAGPNPNKYFN